MRGHFGLFWLVYMLEERHLKDDPGQSDAQVGRLMLAFSASGLDMRIWELLLLRMDS